MNTTFASHSRWASAQALLASKGSGKSVSDRMAQAAAAALLAVLVAVSAYAIWSAVSTRQSAERAIASNVLSDHWAAAAAALAAEESLERKYRLNPSRAIRARFDEASTRLLGAIWLTGQDPTPAGRDLASRLDSSHAAYLEAIDRMFVAVDRADAATVLRIDREDVDPRFDAIDALVKAAANSAEAAGQSDLQDLKKRESVSARATPAVFLGGSILVLVFCEFLRRTRRQLDRQRLKAVHDSLHDALTGLPNRSLLARRFNAALDGAERDRSPPALLLIDLDRFKEINDTLGHDVGDRLLTQVGPRLSEALSRPATIARLGGDEFAVLLPGVDGLNGALDVAASLRAALGRPFMVDSVELDIDASIGIAIAGVHGKDAQSLLRCADVAMYVAKTRRLGVAVYDPGNDSHSPARLALMGQLRNAIRHGELFLLYQPKVDMRSGLLVGVEALVRWRHPERGVVAPDEFIPLAERTGLIVHLTQYVLEAALMQVRRWCDGGRRIPVAVNISAIDVGDVEFAGRIARLLQHHRVAPDLIAMEVTESAVMLEPVRAARVLTELHAMGIRISIDDFGVGYTCLAQLQHLPVSELKMDRSFVAALDTDAADAVVLRSMIDLAHGLHMKVVAEGIETEAGMRRLNALGCDIGQGFHICRPVPAPAMDRWFAAPASELRLPSCSSTETVLPHVA